MKAKIAEIYADIDTAELRALRGYIALLDRKATKGEKLQYVADHTEVDWDAIEGKNVYARSKVNARIKELQANFEFPKGSFEAKILHASDLMSEEKTVKREAKDLAAALHQHTKETIEGLSDEQVLLLLEQKWIVPLVEQLYALPQAAVDGLVKKVSALAQKYAATLTDLDAEITRTEREFSAMLEQLTGNASDMAGLAELKKLLGGV